jgi:hypothetical protein
MRGRIAIKPDSFGSPVSFDGCSKVVSISSFIWLHFSFSCFDLFHSSPESDLREATLMEKRYFTSELSSPSVANSTGTAVVLGVQFYFAQHLHHLRVAVVEEEALLRVQCGDGSHVFAT